MLRWVPHTDSGQNIAKEYFKIEKYRILNEQAKVVSKGGVGT